MLFYLDFSHFALLLKWCLANLMLMNPMCLSDVYLKICVVQRTFSARNAYSQKQEQIDMQFLFMEGVPSISTLFHLTFNFLETHMGL